MDELSDIEQCNLLHKRKRELLDLLRCPRQEFISKMAGALDNVEMSRQEFRLQERVLYTALFPHMKGVPIKDWWARIPGARPRSPCIVRRKEFQRLSEEEKKGVYEIEDSPTIFAIALAYNIKPADFARFSHVLTVTPEYRDIIYGNQTTIVKIYQLYENNLQPQELDTEMKEIKQGIEAYFTQPERLSSLDDLDDSLKKMVKLGREMTKDLGCVYISDPTFVVLSQRYKEKEALEKALKVMESYYKNILNICTRVTRDFFDGEIAKSYRNFIREMVKPDVPECPASESEDDAIPPLNQKDQWRKSYAGRAKLSLEHHEILRDLQDDPCYDDFLTGRIDPQEYIQTRDGLDNLDDIFKDELNSFNGHVEGEETSDQEPRETIQQVLDGELWKNLIHPDEVVESNVITKADVLRCLTQVKAEQQQNKDGGRHFCFFLRDGVRCDVRYASGELFMTHFLEVHYPDVDKQLKFPSRAREYLCGVPIYHSLAQYFVDPTPGSRANIVDEEIVSEGDMYRCLSGSQKVVCRHIYYNFDMIARHICEVHPERLIDCPPRYRTWYNKNKEVPKKESFELKKEEIGVKKPLTYSRHSDSSRSPSSEAGRQRKLKKKTVGFHTLEGNVRDQRMSRSRFRRRRDDEDPPDGGGRKKVVDTKPEIYACVIRSCDFLATDPVELIEHFRIHHRNYGVDIHKSDSDSVGTSRTKGGLKSLHATWEERTDSENQSTELEEIEQFLGALQQQVEKKNSFEEDQSRPYQESLSGSGSSDEKEVEVEPFQEGLIPCPMNGKAGVMCNKMFRIRELSSNAFQRHVRFHEQQAGKKKPTDGGNRLDIKKYQSKLISERPLFQGYSASVDPSTQKFFKPTEEVPKDMSVADSIKLVFDC